MLRKRADAYQFACRSNDPGHTEQGKEFAEAVIRDEFIALAELLEAEKGYAIGDLAAQRAYEKLIQEQST